jgi:hypothetical protein
MDLWFERRRSSPPIEVAFETDCHFLFHNGVRENGLAAGQQEAAEYSSAVFQLCPACDFQPVQEAISSQDG